MAYMTEEEFAVWDKSRKLKVKAQRAAKVTPRGTSALVVSLLVQLTAARVPEPTPELRFAPPRRWRFDLSWPERMLAVEVEGGVFARAGAKKCRACGQTPRGRHSTGKGLTADAEKYNTAALRGWKVLRVTKAHIDDGSALKWIEDALLMTRAKVVIRLSCPAKDSQLDE